MILSDYTRNKYGKCSPVQQTINRIKAGLKKIQLNAIADKCTKISDCIFWTRITCKKKSATDNNGSLFKSEGKGTTEETALASAYAEFVERYSWPVYWGQHIYRDSFYGINKNAERFLNYEWVKGYSFGSYDRTDGAIPLDELFPNETIQHKDFRLDLIKESNIGRHWVDGYSLINQKYLKVPIALISFLNGSNGLASGNNVEEALLQATYEIIERYVGLKVIENRLTVPSISTNSIKNAKISELIKFYNKNKIEVVVKDLSFNNTFTCIGAVFINHNLSSDHMEHRIFKIGASFSLEDALIRCFTERMQGRDDFNPYLQFDQKIKTNPDNHSTFLKIGVSENSLSFLETGKMVLFKESQNDTISKEISNIKKICKRLHTDCIIVNLTHPVIDFPVVRVVMPKLSDIIGYYGIQNFILDTNSIFETGRLQNDMINKFWDSSL